MNNPFLPPAHMTESEAGIIAHQIQSVSWPTLHFSSIEKKTDGEYEVQVSYEGEKKAYQDPGGRQHRLRPGLLRIDSMQEWRDIEAILTKGMNVEF